MRSAKDPPRDQTIKPFSANPPIADPRARSAVGIADRDTGSALRSVYQRTVEEDIPDDLLSLLRKLD